MEGSDDGEDRPPWMIWTLAVTKFVVGTAMCMVFADPLVGSVTDLSRGSGIPGFFIAFVAAPLASNASELVSSLKFAKGQRSRNISITFNQVGGGGLGSTFVGLVCTPAIARSTTHATRTATQQLPHASHGTACSRDVAACVVLLTPFHCVGIAATHRPSLYPPYEPRALTHTRASLMLIYSCCRAVHRMLTGWLVYVVLLHRCMVPPS